MIKVVAKSNFKNNAVYESNRARRGVRSELGASHSAGYTWVNQRKKVTMGVTEDTKRSMMNTGPPMTKMI